jgi:hypothetical protein
MIILKLELGVKLTIPVSYKLASLHILKRNPSDLELDWTGLINTVI